MQLRERKMSEHIAVAQHKSTGISLVSSISDEIQDSETEEFQSSDEISGDSSAEGTIAVVSKRTRKVQVSRKDLLKGSKILGKNSGSILKFTKANVVNTVDFSEFSELERHIVSDSDAFESPPKRFYTKRKRIVRSPSSDSAKPSRARSNRTLKKSYKELSSDDENAISVDSDHEKRCTLNISASSDAKILGKNDKTSYESVIDKKQIITNIVNEETMPDFSAFAYNCNGASNKKSIKPSTPFAVTQSKGSPLRGSKLPSNDRHFSISDGQEVEEKHFAAYERRPRRQCAPNLLREPLSDEDIFSSPNVKDSKDAGRTRNQGASTSKKQNSGQKECTKSTNNLPEVSGAVSEETMTRNASKLKVGKYGLETEEGEMHNMLVKRVGTVEKILAVRSTFTQSPVYCVKEYGKSYRNVVYAAESLLQKQCAQLLRNFSKRIDVLQRVDGHPGDSQEGPAFDPLYLVVDRIVATEQRGRKKHYLVKWKGLPYREATWEMEDSMRNDADAIQRFNLFNSKPSLSFEAQPFPSVFKDGRTLREYQKEGLTWLEHNFKKNVNCVLADEMGLGKTIQSISMLEAIRKKWKIRGPFLVIAPVSTLGHWQREIESLTHMNCIVYAGSQEDRIIIQKHEFNYPASKTRELKFNVLLTSFEILMKDLTIFAKQRWQYLIVDEAHRLKSLHSKTTCALRQMEVRKGGLLLLTGTPVQNNTKEIFSLLNILDPETFASEQEFLKKYGDIKNVDQIKDLQDNVLRPRLLRRMKEDVEKSIPQKEETIIWVELTKEQRAYYKAIYESRISDLLKGSQSGNLPNLRNMAMELRKLCNHPFLCGGLEEDLLSKQRASGLTLADEDVLMQKVLTQSSGKMILMDKILPMLKDSGRRVLIFSQFTIMLDLLEDYLHSKSYSFERIDGKIRGVDRQAAIDRYSAEGSEIFVFLLSTRAGGLGITLTAADTCIIYDSDWNPQNDLQAMARCHRIGQTKDVKIYRLITRNTYEQKLFESSSLKYGLDEAILGSMLHADEDQSLNKNIENLLKHGAYDILKEDREAQAAEFSAQNIEQILEQRTEKRLIGGRGKNMFSVATFVPNSENENKRDVEIESENFWQKMLPQACQAAQGAVIQEQTYEGRRRTKVNYRERGQSSDEDSTKNRAVHCARLSRDGKVILDDIEISESEEDENQWSEQELKRLESSLLRLGEGRTKQIILDCHLENRSHAEVEQVIEVFIKLCHYYKAKRKQELALAHNPEINLQGEVLPGGEGSKLLEISQKQRELQNNNMQSSIPALDNSLPQERVMTKSSSSEKLNAEVSNRKCNNFEGATPDRPILPNFAEKALSSQGFIDRVKKYCTRYLQTLHDCKLLSEAVALPDSIPPEIPRSFKLPTWWGPQEDLDLMKGAHKHGYKNFKKISLDPSLVFATKILEQASKTSQNTKEAVNTEPLGSNIEAKLPTFKEQTQSNDWPSDCVLSGRLKKLIKSLSHGFPEAEIKHCVDKELAQKHATATRNVCAKQCEEVHQRDKQLQSSHYRPPVEKGSKRELGHHRSVGEKASEKEFDHHNLTPQKPTAKLSRDALNSGQAHAANITGRNYSAPNFQQDLMSPVIQAAAYEETVYCAKDMARQNAFTPKIVGKQDSRVMKGKIQLSSSDIQYQASHLHSKVGKGLPTNLDNNTINTTNLTTRLSTDATYSGQVHAANKESGIHCQRKSLQISRPSEALKTADFKHEKAPFPTKNVARENVVIPGNANKRDWRVMQGNDQSPSKDVMVRSMPHVTTKPVWKPRPSNMDQKYEISGVKSKAATSHSVTQVYVEDSSSDDSTELMLPNGSFRHPIRGIPVHNHLLILDSKPIQGQYYCNPKDAPSAPACQILSSTAKLSVPNILKKDATSSSVNKTVGSLQRHRIIEKQPTNSYKENEIPARKSISLTSTVNRSLNINNDGCKQKTLLGFLAPKLSSSDSMRKPLLHYNANSPVEAVFECQK